MRAWWLLACGLIACVRSQAVTCANGTLCPEGFSCVVGGGCAAVGPCGDGVINLGEECDDANHASHDGCSSGCLLEQPTWIDASDPAGPTLRRGHGMAWFPDAGVGVLHGGTGQAVLADTWLWDGHWTRAADGPDRTFHQIAYDGTSRVIMFGGTDTAGQRRGETFAWDGAAWTQVADTGPAPRFNHLMARDTEPGVVMWGGISVNGLELDTWRWDGAQWTRRADQNMQQDLRLTYVPLDNTVLATGSSMLLIYVWNGAWTTRDSSLVRQDHAQDYDPDRRTVIAFGGVISTSFFVNAADEWNGVDWARIEVAGQAPPVRENTGGFYDPIRHGFVIFGGDMNASFLDDTWVLRWDSATPDDACDGTSDADGDDLVGCADPDCWARRQPHCPPGAPCDPAAPHCGDGACNPALESAALCPDDC